MNRRLNPPLNIQFRTNEGYTQNQQTKGLTALKKAKNAESTNKGDNTTYETSHVYEETQQEKPESRTVTMIWHVSKYGGT